MTDDSKRYVGKCIAWVGGRIVASGHDRLEAYQKAKKLYPQQRMILRYIPKKEETLTFLWDFRINSLLFSLVFPSEKNSSLELLVKALSTAQLSVILAAGDPFEQLPRRYERWCQSSHGWACRANEPCLSTKCRDTFQWTQQEYSWSLHRCFPAFWAPSPAAGKSVGICSTLLYGCSARFSGCFLKYAEEKWLLLFP